MSIPHNPRKKTDDKSINRIKGKQAMKLNFMGATYQNTTRSVDTLPSDLTGQFLGKPYSLRRPVETPRQPKLGLRKYRGVTY
jgi:hypothetical protein